MAARASIPPARPPCALLTPLREVEGPAAEVDRPVPSCSVGGAELASPTGGVRQDPTEGMARWEQKRVFTTERRAKAPGPGGASPASSQDEVGPGYFSPWQRGLSPLPKTGLCSTRNVPGTSGVTKPPTVTLIPTQIAHEAQLVRC